MGISIIEYEKALFALEESLSAMRSALDPVLIKICRDATIQRFEFCIELSWKISAKVLGSSSTTAKPVIREMAQNNLIDDVGLWFDFVEARNKTSHSYDEKVAEEVLASSRLFAAPGLELARRLKTR